MTSAFTRKYELQPALVQSLLAYASLTWLPKLFYGVIADLFTIFGSRRKSYFIIFSCLQIIASLMAAFGTSEESYGMVMVAGCLILFSQAFMDVIADGLLINQQKKDPEHGSEDL